MVQYSLTEYVSLLADERFCDLDFTVVREHVPFLRDITYEQLKAAVKRHKVSIQHQSVGMYACNMLSNLLPLYRCLLVGTNAAA